MYSTNRIIRAISLAGAIVLVTFALSPTSPAVDPTPGGGSPSASAVAASSRPESYPNQNMAEGEDARRTLPLVLVRS